MKKMTLKNQIIVGALAISVFIMLVSTLAVAYIINRQNVAASHEFLKQAFRVILDDLALRQTKLASAVHQLATVEMMGSTVKYIRENVKPDIAAGQDISPYQAAYRNIAYTTYQIGQVANIWQISIYDRDNDLIAFATFDAKGARVGYVTGFPRPVSYVAIPQKDEDLSGDERLWQRLETIEGIEPRFGATMPEAERIDLTPIAQSLCLVAYAPIMGNLFNKESRKLEPVQIGVVKAVQRFDQALVERLANLTDIKLNVFTPEGLSVGTFPEYATLQADASQDLKTPRPLTLAALTFKNVILPNGNYFQGMLPLYRGEAYSGAIAALYSQAIARSNTLQMIKTLSLIALGCIILILPIALVFSNSITNPIKQIIQDIKEGIIHGDFSKTIQIEQAGEIGQLAQAFQAMKTSIGKVLTELEALIQAIQAGKLGTRGNASAFVGGWHDLVAGVNNVIDAFVAPIAMASGALDRIAKGDIPEKITEEYNGDFNTIKLNLNLLIEAMQAITRIAEAIADGNLRVEAQERSEQDRLMKALNTMISRLNRFSQEIDGLVQAVQAGKLSVRGQTGAFAGGWRDLVIGVNHVLDAFVAPIVMAAVTIDRIAKGDLPQEIVAEFQGDFNEIKQNLNILIRATQDVTRLAEQLAAGDLTFTVAERSAQDVLMRALNVMIAKLKDVVIQVQAAANNVAAGSRELRANSEDMSQGVGQQAASMEEASSSMQEIAANINQNADNARETEKIALQSAEYAEESGKVVAETVVAMQQIAKKISIIQEIADQTRMLSLNATIEAARAQEQGRAFAVVAAEVRKLSDIVRTAANEINELASSSVHVAENAGRMLTKLVPNIHKTAELVQEISAASGEQSSGSAQINKAIQQLDQVTQQNAALSDSLASASEELSVQAEQLQRIMRFFRIGKTAQRVLEEQAAPEETIFQESPLPIKTKRSKMPNREDRGLNRTKGGEQADRNYDSVASKKDDRDEEFERY